MLARLTPPGHLARALLQPPTDDGRAALVDATSGEVLSYEALRRRVEARLGELALPERSIAVLTGPNSLEWVVTYLALLAGDHVPLPVPAHAEQLATTWGAAAVIDAPSDGVDIRRFEAPSPPVHDDLALLLSTSGSTGSPKLVRLSHRNLVANARSIAEYQRLTGVDRGITSLPLHYCFGLSVLHSHLLVGASVVVTDGSVVDPCFRAQLTEGGVTNLAGVPHTFELMERVGPAEYFGPDLRFLAQAGGKLGADRVGEWAARADAAGAELFVMYGQTEATARMAYLPPSLALRRPETIGVAIPDGRLRLDPLADHPDGDVGELVYEGPNVMMGYATDAADLLDGSVTSELRTGDLARFHEDDNVFEIVGRRSRFVKPFGLRIDLDLVESQLRSVVPGGANLGVAGDDQRIVVFTDAGADRVVEQVVAATGLPAGSVDVHATAPPRTASGKIDEATMRAAAEADQPVAHGSDAEDVAAVYRTVLGRRSVAPTDTFVTLGGDSLSYVECSIRLERALGRLPSDWHLRSVADLSVSAGAPSRWARVDTSVLIRALAICMVVATHMRLWRIPGGSHTLLAVAGYNMARFVMPLAPAERLRAGLRTAGRAAIPTMAWAAAAGALFGTYNLVTTFLVNNYAGPAHHRGDHWHFWFVEVFVQLTIVVTLLVSVPRIARLDRRYGWVVPLSVLAVALVLRMDWLAMPDAFNLKYRTHGVAFFFALGWLAQRAGSVRERIAVSVAVVAVIPGFFDQVGREWRIIGFVLLLLWIPQLPMPRFAVGPLGVLAAASLWIYVSHFAIWPALLDVVPEWAAYMGTLLAGVGLWFVTERSLGLLNTWRQGRPRFLATSPQPLRGTA